MRGTDRRLHHHRAADRHRARRGPARDLAPRGSPPVRGRPRRVDLDLRQGSAAPGRVPRYLQRYRRRRGARPARPRVSSDVHGERRVLRLLHGGWPERRAECRRAVRHEHHEPEQVLRVQGDPLDPRLRRQSQRRHDRVRQGWLPLHRHRRWRRQRRSNAHGAEHHESARQDAPHRRRQEGCRQGVRGADRQPVRQRGVHGRPPQPVAVVVRRRDRRHVDRRRRPGRDRGARRAQGRRAEGQEPRLERVRRHHLLYEPGRQVHADRHASSVQRHRHGDSEGSTHA